MYPWTQDPGFQQWAAQQPGLPPQMVSMYRQAQSGRTIPPAMAGIIDSFYKMYKQQAGGQNAQGPSPSPDPVGAAFGVPGGPGGAASPPATMGGPGAVPPPPPMGAPQPDQGAPGGLPMPLQQSQGPNALDAGVSSIASLMAQRGGITPPALQGQVVGVDPGSLEHPDPNAPMFPNAGINIQFPPSDQGMFGHKLSVQFGNPDGASPLPGKSNPGNGVGVKNKQTADGSPPIADAGKVNANPTASASKSAGSRPTNDQSDRADGDGSPTSGMNDWQQGFVNDQVGMQPVQAEIAPPGGPGPQNLPDGGQPPPMAGAPGEETGEAVPDAEGAAETAGLNPPGTREFNVNSPPPGGPKKRDYGTPGTPEARAGKPYVIRRGDTLYDIAKAVLGDGNRYKEIAKMNGIKNPSKIQVGKTLKLPPRAAGGRK